VIVHRIKFPSLNSKIRATTYELCYAPIILTFNLLFLEVRGKRHVHRKTTSVRGKMGRRRLLEDVRHSYKTLMQSVKALFGYQIAEMGLLKIPTWKELPPVPGMPLVEPHFSHNRTYTSIM
jgi:hypothetical protein